MMKSLIICHVMWSWGPPDWNLGNLPLAAVRCPYKARMGSSCLEEILIGISVMH